jgi:hypothetical protein
MHKNEIIAGRLLESTIASPFSESECADCILQARMLLLSTPGRVVAAADLTGLQVMPQPIADMVEQLFHRDNAKVDRSGILVSPRYPAASMQVVRLAQRANNPDRRVFGTDRRDEMVAWLSGVLTPAEQARLRTFVGEVGMQASALASR